MGKTIFIFSIMVVLFLRYPLKAQDSVQVAIISPKIGGLIEPEEQNYYKILPYTREFILAYFYKSSGEHYKAKVYFLYKKLLTEKNIIMTENELLIKGETINNYENIKSKQYTAGENPAEIKFVWIDRNEIRKKIEEQLKSEYGYLVIPGTESDYSKFLISYPRLGFNFGILYSNFDFSEMTSLTNSINNFFREQGVVIRSVKPNYSVSVFIRFKGELEINRNITASLMVDYDAWVDDISYNALTLVAQYKFNDLIGGIVPVAGLGYTLNNFKITVDYGHTVINDTGGQLESVTVDGGTDGPVAEAGIIFPLEDWFNISLMADFYMLSNYKYTEDRTGFSSEIRPGTFSAGIYFNFLF